MENASKALIMAGGVLIALLIIGALLLMFNNLMTYQNSEIQNEREAQIIEFNNQFSTYIRDEVRGSDLLSLVNRIIDYNLNTSQEGFQKMEITVKIAKNEDIIREKFSYDNDRTNYPKLIETEYNQDNIEGRLTSIVKNLETKYNSGTINYISNLSSNISNVMDSEEKTQKILPKNLSNYGGYDQIKEDTLTYYEYTQLKRAYFDCKQVEYNQQNGRIVKLQFEFDSSRIFE